MEKLFDNIVRYVQSMLIPYGLNTMETVGFYVSMVIGALFTILYTYQFVYVFIAFVRKPLRYPETDQTKRYAVIIAARNEQLVLPELLKSIAGQTYPTELIDTYVVADNCTDNTAGVARELGAIVYERQNKEKVGKGYALQFDKCFAYSSSPNKIWW